MFRSLILAATALWTLAACATPEPTVATAEPPAGRDCFNASMVNGFSPIDDTHVKLSVGANRHYALTTQQRIVNSRYYEHVGIQSTTNWICTGNGLGVTLLVPDDVQRRYFVSEVARLPDDPVPAAAAQPPAPQGS